MDNCKQLRFLKVPKPMPTKLLIYMTLSLQQNQCKAWLEVLPSITATELNTGQTTEGTDKTRRWASHTCMSTLLLP